MPEKFCAGESVTLFAAGALSYTWLPFSTTGNTTSVLPNSNQIIIALGTGVNTCTSTAYLLLEPDACLSASETTEDIKLRIYPQPAGHFFTIESDIVIEQLNFFSGNGQIIARKTINNKNANVSVDELKAGLYIVEVKLQTGRIIYRKLIKQ